MTITQQTAALTADSALVLVQRALALGADLGGAFSVTVVGPQMELIAFARADGATPHSGDSSRRKANTAASTRRETGWMGEDLAVPLALATDLRLTNIPGGAPVVVDGAVVGAVGVAGGTPAQDEQVARAAVAAVS